MVPVNSTLTGHFPVYSAGTATNVAVFSGAAGQSLANTMNDYVGLINASPNLADILHRGANGLSSLKESEVIQFCAFLDQSFIDFETFYFQWKAGVLVSPFTILRQRFDEFSS